MALRACVKPLCSPPQSFGSAMIVTWEALLSSMGAIITNGGTAGLFWGYMIVVLGYLLVYLSLAEMSSMVCVGPHQLQNHH